MLESCSVHEFVLALIDVAAAYLTRFLSIYCDLWYTFLSVSFSRSNFLWNETWSLIYLLRCYYEHFWFSRTEWMNYFLKHALFNCMFAYSFVLIQLKDKPRSSIYFFKCHPHLPKFKLQWIVSGSLLELGEHALRLWGHWPTVYWQRLFIMLGVIFLCRRYDHVMLVYHLLRDSSVSLSVILESWVGL